VCNHPKTLQRVLISKSVGHNFLTPWTEAEIFPGEVNNADLGVMPNFEYINVFLRLSILYHPKVFNRLYEWPLCHYCQQAKALDSFVLVL
jgi:hypothetical protein